MSRKRLDHKLNELSDRLLTPERIKRHKEIIATMGQEESVFVSNIREAIENLSDEQRINIFSSKYKLTNDQYEREYLAGDTTALMSCIDFCDIQKIPIPNWAVEAFHQGYKEIRNYNAKGWDDVFGNPHKKGIHLKGQRQSARIRPVFFCTVSIKRKAS